MKRTLISVFLCGVLLSLLTGCDFFDSLYEKYILNQESSSEQKTSTAVQKPVSETAPMKPNTLARVGSWSITIDEFNERLKALKEVVPDFDDTSLEAQNLVLEELVRQQLFVEDAEQNGQADSKDIKSAVEEFRRSLIVREAAGKLMEGITVSEDEAKKFYDEKVDSLVNPVELRVREIVVDTQLKANELLTEVLKGADFAETAKQNSISDSAAKGGDLGFLSEAPFDAMAEAALDLKEGEVSSVFKGPKGYYIIKLEEKKGGDTIPFEDIKEDIIQNRTIFKQQQAVLEHINKLKEKIKVEINDSLLTGEQNEPRE